MDSKVFERVHEMTGNEQLDLQEREKMTRSFELDLDLPKGSLLSVSPDRRVEPTEDYPFPLHIVTSNRRGIDGSLANPNMLSFAEWRMQKLFNSDTQGYEVEDLSIFLGTVIRADAIIGADSRGAGAQGRVLPLFSLEYLGADGNQRVGIFYKGSGFGMSVKSSLNSNYIDVTSDDFRLGRIDEANIARVQMLTPRDDESHPSAQPDEEARLLLASGTILSFLTRGRIGDAELDSPRAHNSFDEPPLRDYFRSGTPARGITGGATNSAGIVWQMERPDDSCIGPRTTYWA